MPKLAYTLAHVSAVLWSLLWWWRFWWRREKPVGRWYWTIKVHEHETPDAPEAFIANFGRMLAVMMLAAVVDFLPPSRLHGVIAPAIHLGVALSFGTVVYGRLTLRAIPTGCLLLLYLPCDIATWIDLRGATRIAAAIGIGPETFALYRGRFFLFWAVAIAAILLQFSRWYRDHTEHMGIKENPAPIYFLFLAAGVSSILVVGAWAWNL